MQPHGLEWLWRLVQEPRRLWRRYLLLNPAYLALLAVQRVTRWTVSPKGKSRRAGRPHPGVVRLPRVFVRLPCWV